MPGRIALRTFTVSETICAWAQRPTDFRSTCLRYWGQQIEPLWGLQLLRRYPHGGSWVPPLPVWAAHPHRRLVICEGQSGGVGMLWVSHIFGTSMTIIQPSITALTLCLGQL